MERRHFLMTTAAAAGVLLRPRLASANDTVRVACVGVRGQGRSHLQQYGKMKNVEIAAICDVDENILDDRLNMVEKASGKRPARYTDLRKLLEDKSIDAVSIATPNHNHTLQAIWSLQAGKDVYVEKPCSHNIYECRQIVAAAKKYGKIVQHGVNARSSAGGAGSGPEDARGRDRRSLHGARPVLQVARYDWSEAGEAGARGCPL